MSDSPDFFWYHLILSNTIWYCLKCLKCLRFWKVLQKRVEMIDLVHSLTVHYFYYLMDTTFTKALLKTIQPAFTCSKHHKDQSDMWNLYQATLRKKCPYSELLWSAFSLIRTEYEEILRASPYSAQRLENADQSNSEYGHFWRSTNNADTIATSTTSFLCL